MKEIRLTINGIDYPCRMTMGAMLYFKQTTDRELTDMDGSMSDLATLLYCMTKSASKADGVKFDMSLEDFANGISAEDMTKAQDSLNEGDNGTDTKKKKK